ncbi:hypothetical protein D3C80_1774850 [compost metagenome]
MLAGQGLDVGAGALAVLPEGQQFADLFQGKPQVARALDKGQGVQVIGAVDPIAAVGTMGGLEQADGFVIADHLRAQAALAGRLADVHRLSSSCLGVQNFNSNALLTTLTLDSAMAAPASTGLRNPNAARGMPIKL